MAKFQIKVGSKWDGVDAVIEGEGGEPKQLITMLKDLSDFKLKKKEVVDRFLLGAAIVVVFGLALLTASVWGWQTADFSGLKAVWAAGSVPLGWVAGRYFGKDGSRS
jgi:hypothetical protein